MLRIAAKVAVCVVAVAAVSACGGDVASAPKLPPLRGAQYDDAGVARAGRVHLSAYGPAARKDAVEVLVVVRRDCAPCGDAARTASILAERADRRVTVTTVLAGEATKPGIDVLDTFDALGGHGTVVEWPPGPYGRLPAPTTFVIGPGGRPRVRVDGPLSGIAGGGNLKAVDDGIRAALSEVPIPDFPAWLAKDFPGVAALPITALPDDVVASRPRDIARLVMEGSDDPPGPGVARLPWYLVPTGPDSVALVSELDTFSVSRDLAHPTSRLRVSYSSQDATGYVGIVASDVMSVVFTQGGKVLCRTRVQRNVYACSWPTTLSDGPTEKRAVMRDGSVVEL